MNDIFKNTLNSINSDDLKLKSITRKLIEFENEDNFSLADLSSEARNVIKSIQAQLQELSRSGETDPDILEQVTVAKEQFQLSRDSYRRNLVIAEEKLNKLGRKNLFDGVRQRKVDSKEKNDGEDVNMQLESLNRTMASALEGSGKTLENLFLASEKLTKTKEDATKQTSHVEDGAMLISKYKRRERMDKILIFLGVLTFFSTVAYILLKRMFGFFT